MKNDFTNKEGAVIISDIIKTIQCNKQYLSDIDGEIGDGDHGINMNKGFSMCEEELKKQSGDLVYNSNMLSKILIMKIGGSMGPLYGKLFKGFANELQGEEIINKKIFGNALNAMYSEIHKISPAKLGDKTLIDTLLPAIVSYNCSLEKDMSFQDCLMSMDKAAEKGKESTRELIAKLGRASRLGERSKGVLDAGATSCYLILDSMAKSIVKLLN